MFCFCISLRFLNLTHSLQHCNMYSVVSLLWDTTSNLISQAKLYSWHFFLSQLYSFLEFSKAFDKEGHELLLYKLNLLNLDPKLLAWIECILLNHSQFVSDKWIIKEINELYSLIKGKQLFSLASLSIGLIWLLQKIKPLVSSDFSFPHSELDKMIRRTLTLWMK